MPPRDRRQPRSVFDLATMRQVLGPGNADGVFELNTATVRDISADVLGPDGRMRILPAAFWAATTPQERALFGHLNGLYSFPTVELVDHLRTVIGDRTAIEIGAGHGVLADALGIPGTDSRMQEKPKYRHIYAMTGQPTVPYGPNIIHADAARALRRHRPDVVIGCWVTHRYSRQRHWAGGNEDGVVEEEILAGGRTYIAIGNTQVHRHKNIWTRPHTLEHPPYVYSRAQNGTPDFIATWEGDRR